jgi:hypothetical protein
VFVDSEGGNGTTSYGFSMMSVDLKAELRASWRQVVIQCGADLFFVAELAHTVAQVLTGSAFVKAARRAARVMVVNFIVGVSGLVWWVEKRGELVSSLGFGSL